MKTETQRNIYSTLERLELLRSAEKQYQVTKSELEEAEEKLADLSKRAEKELNDIKKLEGLSIRSIFHRALGSKARQMEKEKQEYLEVSLQYNEYLKQIELMEYELSLLERRTGEIAQVEKELESLKKIREQEILETPTSKREELLDIHRKMDESKRYSVELTEALRAAEGALDSLMLVKNHLSRARNWGHYGHPHQHKRQSAHVRRTSVDRAIDEARQTNYLIHIFVRKLENVGVDSYGLDFKLEIFHGFLDMLFANLISDWIIQSRIKNAMIMAEETEKRIRLIIGVLKEDIDIENQNGRHLENLKNEILTR
ncbi:MAG TPA: hypothetical protein PKC30_10445 [Saprospiraceae bacterium]|nr:hypothetical protein [Saprospiraceae bacterium]